MKKILVLTGSNSDINKKVDGEDTPTKLADDLDATVEALNKANPEQQLDYHLQVCSADRTDHLLARIINQERFDGIIGAGGYALVLAASVISTLNDLRRREGVEDWSRSTRNFFAGDTGSMLIPRPLVMLEESKYFQDASYIPFIGVPGKDTPSQGVTALTSITENPPGCEPRPVVGLDKIDSAVRCIHNMMYSSFGRVTIVQGTGVSPVSLPGEKILEILQSFGPVDAKVIRDNDVPREYKQAEDELLMFVDGAKGYNAEPYRPVWFLDEKARFMINCCEKANLTTNGLWENYLHTLNRLNNTVSVGVGNYDNAAILAAQLLRKPDVLEGMWKYRNGKTQSGVMYQPTFLKEGKVVRQ